MTSAISVIQSGGAAKASGEEGAATITEEENIELA